MGRILLIGLVVVMVFLALMALLHAAAPYVAALIIVCVAGKLLTSGENKPDT